MIGNKSFEDIANDVRLASRYWDIHGNSKPLHMDMDENGKNCLGGL